MCILRYNLHHHRPQLVNNRLRVVHAVNMTSKLNPRLQERSAPLVTPELVRFLIVACRVHCEERGQVPAANRTTALERRKLLARLACRLVRRLAEQRVPQNGRKVRLLGGIVGWGLAQGVRQVNQVRHVLLLAHRTTTLAHDDVLCIDTEELCDWCGGRREHVGRAKVGKKGRVVRKGVAFRAEVIDEEAVEHLDHVRVVELCAFASIINQLNSVVHFVGP